METKEFKKVKDLFGKKFNINKPTGSEYNTDSYELLKDSSRLLDITPKLDSANGLWHYEFENLDIPIRCIIDNELLYVFGLNLNDLSEEQAERLEESIIDYFKKQYNY